MLSSVERAAKRVPRKEGNRTGAIVSFVKALLDGIYLLYCWCRHGPEIIHSPETQKILRFLVSQVEEKIPPFEVERAFFSRSTRLETQKMSVFKNVPATSLSD